MVRFDYNIEEGYVEILFLKEVSQAEVINMLKSIKDHNEFPKDLKMFIDGTNGKLAINPDELQVILNENIKMFETFNTLKVAIVIDKPVDTAIAVIYNRMIQLERYEFKVFNTLMAAKVWLQKGMQGSYRIYPNTPLSSDLAN